MELRASRPLYLCRVRQFIALDNLTGLGFAVKKDDADARRPR